MENDNNFNNKNIITNSKPSFYDLKNTYNIENKSNFNCYDINEKSSF
jgi:hypothetical protein